MPAIKSKKIARLSVFTLDDEAEQDDNCAQIYHKSLLYLVSNAFEEKPRIPLARDGVAILGMEKFIRKDNDLQQLFMTDNCEWILSPNTEAEGSIYAAKAKHHGDFDDDVPTVIATLKRILGVQTKIPEGTFQFSRSASSLKDKRSRLTGGPVS